MTQSSQLSNGSEEATSLVAPSDLQHAVFESLALKGDISNLSAEQKALYLEKLCNSLGLNPLTQPFVPLKLGGKEVLYASRGCTDQLANIHKLTREIIKTEEIQGVYIATCKVSGPDGRFDISTGAVPITNLKGDNLANALMKAETKAKRRATLCYCGLGFLDESEIETIPKDRVEFFPATKGELVDSARKDVTVERVNPAPISGVFTIDIPEQANFEDLRNEIVNLGHAISADVTPALKYVDDNPDRIEAGYTRVAKRVLKTVFESERWGRTEEGTREFLEKHGITVLDDASRGQLASALNDLNKEGILTIPF
jgi:hypothetical protein